ncbi:LacI family DNA-binding transcriptional regulator [Microbacterium sp. STN6]|uniref:LacI family DNA-binding transcriptional regulator n=1 Tax=Microbacterium sp. STN6 TaxID=2995588 RepID=UPI002260A43C|nr:LacI family DNA-binding transcriptional regulator [Microbacterium sp. STN6]MCX7522527.1 LacI family DNA-binding transcriptional regulator [Microbacterium sp. STN6]
MVSIRDVAMRASVSIGTVSKYLNTPHRVAPDTKKRIRKAINELGYVRNEAARQLRAGESKTLAFVALELNNPFFGEFADAMERRAAENGLFLFIVGSNGDPEREGQYIEMFAQQRVYGVILASGLTRQKELDLLFTRRIPTVLVDAYAATDRFSSTSVDDFLGAERAVTHLIEQGCRSIAFIGGEIQIHQIAERLRGARSAVDAHPGVRLDVIPTVERSVPAGLAVGEQLLGRPRAELPDGIFAANDSLAMGIMQAISSESELRIPEDVAIVGYDDIDYASSAGVPLSTVRRPREVFGRSAVDLVRDQAESTESLPVRRIVIQPELIIRQSSQR